MSAVTFTGRCQRRGHTSFVTARNGSVTTLTTVEIVCRTSLMRLTGDLLVDCSPGRSRAAEGSGTRALGQAHPGASACQASIVSHVASRWTAAGR